MQREVVIHIGTKWEEDLHHIACTWQLLKNVDKTQTTTGIIFDR